MALSKRVSRLVRSYLEKQWRRLEELNREYGPEGHARAKAEQELQEALLPPSPPATLPSPPSFSTPTTPEEASRPTATPAPEWEIRRCYRVLGLEESTDFALVRRTYAQLMRRCDPARFPEGSEERAKAESIQAQIERAYQILLKRFDTATERFGEIEIPE